MYGIYFYFFDFTDYKIDYTDCFDYDYKMIAQMDY